MVRGITRVASLLTMPSSVRLSDTRLSSRIVITSRSQVSFRMMSFPCISRSLRILKVHPSSSPITNPIKWIIKRLSITRASNNLRITSSLSTLPLQYRTIADEVTAEITTIATETTIDGEMRSHGREAGRDQLIIIIRAVSTPHVIGMRGRGASTVGVAHRIVRIHLRAARARIEGATERGAGVAASPEGARHLRSTKRNVGMWIREGVVARQTQGSRVWFKQLVIISMKSMWNKREIILHLDKITKRCGRTKLRSKLMSSKRNPIINSTMRSQNMSSRNTIRDNSHLLNNNISRPFIINLECSKCTSSNSNMCILNNNTMHPCITNNSQPLSSFSTSTLHNNSQSIPLSSLSSNLQFNKTHLQAR